MAKKVLIAGASGLIGSRLTELLLQKGIVVSHLGRRTRSGKVPSHVWNIEQGMIDPQALENVDAIINLAGAGVADERWTTRRKKEILDSRIQSTALLYRELKKSNHRVNTFIAASAIGYYGLETGEEWVNENNRPGADFLAQVVLRWEEEAEKISSLGIRVVKLRIGIVLSEKGGALKSMAAPVKMGLGSALGDGKQYLTWIHLDDLCAMFIKAVEDQRMSGPYNAVGVQPITNLALTRAIAAVLKKPLWLPPLPGFMLKILLGEMANMVIYGAKVSPEKIQGMEFEFQYGEINTALKNLLGNLKIRLDQPN